MYISKSQIITEVEVGNNVLNCKNKLKVNSENKIMIVLVMEISIQDLFLENYSSVQDCTLKEYKMGDQRLCAL